MVGQRHHPAGDSGNGDEWQQLRKDTSSGRCGAATGVVEARTKVGVRDHARLDFNPVRRRPRGANTDVALRERIRARSFERWVGRRIERIGGLHSAARCYVVTRLDPHRSAAASRRARRNARS